MNSLVGKIEFALNPEPRAPAMILADRSTSMKGKPIQELNKGMRILKDALLNDPMASNRVEIAVVQFGGVKLVHDFATADMFNPPTLKANGGTPMGEAILYSLDATEKREAEYDAHGVPHHPPNYWLITDGGPTDDWQAAAKRIHELAAQGKLQFFGIGVEGADMETLARICPPDNPPVYLADLDLENLFKFISVSMGQIASRAIPMIGEPTATVSMQELNSAPGFVTD